MVGLNKYISGCQHLRGFTVTCIILNIIIHISSPIFIVEYVMTKHTVPKTLLDYAINDKCANYRRR